MQVIFFLCMLWLRLHIFSYVNFHFYFFLLWIACSLSFAYFFWDVHLLLLIYKFSLEKKISVFLFPMLGKTQFFHVMFPSFVSPLLLHRTFNFWSPNMRRFFPIPSNSRQSSWIFYSWTQFWQHLPGDSIRSHRLRALSYWTILPYFRCWLPCNFFLSWL